jgi:hypothetical protein
LISDEWIASDGSELVPATDSKRRRSLVVYLFLSQKADEIIIVQSFGSKDPIHTCNEPA